MRNFFFGFDLMKINKPVSHNLKFIRVFFIKYKYILIPYNYVFIYLVRINF